MLGLSCEWPADDSNEISSTSRSCVLKRGIFENDEDEKLYALFKGMKTDDVSTEVCYVLTHKAPPIIAADDKFKFCCFFKNNK